MIKQVQNLDTNSTDKWIDIDLDAQLAPIDHGRERAEAAIRRTLSNLQTDYLDLYLVHWPGVQGKVTVMLRYKTFLLRIKNFQNDDLLPVSQQARFLSINLKL